MPQRFAKLFREFEKFDDAWRKHLGSEPHVNDTMAVRHVAFPHVGDGSTQIIHTLDFSPSRVKNFFAEIGELNHVKITGERTVEQIVPRELFFGDERGNPKRTKPTSATEKLIYGGRGLKEVVDKISQMELRFMAERKKRNKN